MFLVALMLYVPPVNGDSAEGGPYYSGPQPFVVWIQTDPWAMVIGADTPRLALYEDGTAICLEARPNGPSTYLAAKFTPAKLDEVRQHILGLGSFAALKPRYELTPGVSDMPTAKFFLKLDGAQVVTEVYGLMAGDTALAGYTRSPSKRPPDNPPDSVISLHKYLAALRCVGGATWTPQYVEVMLWPYEYAPDESVAWPRDWPGLTSPDTLARGDAYSIYLPGTRLDELRRLLSTLKPKGALEVGGKKWAVSYRYAFPSEPVWRKALARQ
jgi:hypothetical protein